MPVRLLAAPGAFVASWLVLTLVAAGLALSWPSAASPAAEDGGEKPKLPPLVIDRSLRLDESSAEKAKAQQFLDINQACFVCHENYKTEELVGWHAQEKVGCIKCHGPSLAHRNDEDNVTPPDIMFPPEKIEAACIECHDTHDAPAKDVIARWQQRCPQKTDPAALLCTDCHGHHRLEKRVVRWDKSTGKLLGTTDQGPPAAP
jgi:hypothetical protein